MNHDDFASAIPLTEIWSYAGSLPKEKYKKPFGSTKPNIGSKEDFDNDREKRIRLYSARWEKGYECLTGERLWDEDREEWKNWRKYYDIKTKEQKNILSEGK